MPSQDLLSGRRQKNCVPESHICTQTSLLTGIEVRFSIHAFY